MKKFQFAAGLLALATLGACSSDAPEVVGGGEAENPGDVNYLALNITTVGITRVEGDEEVRLASPAEDAVNDVTLDILNASGGALRRLSSSSVVNGKAYFAVTSYVFEDLQKYLATGTGGKVILKVYANSAKNNYQFEEDSYSSTAVVNGSTWNATNGFLMSNIGQTQAYLSAPGVDMDGTSTDNAWVINAGNSGECVTVELSRLCSRFDLEDHANATNGTYNSTSDSDLKITIDGVSIHTHENSAYWFQQSNMNTPNCTFGNGVCNGTIKLTFDNTAHLYDLKLPSSGTEANPAKSTVYAHPHTIASSVATEGYHFGFANCAYAAIRCTFTHKDIPADATEVYSYNGYFLGTWDQFKDNTLKDLYATYPDAGDEKIQTWITATQTSPSLSKTSFEASNNVVKYTKNTNGKWYTYYSVLLLNEAAADDEDNRTRDNTMIKRNTCYKISVASIKNLGFNRTDVPRDETPDQMLNIMLNIKVADWVKNDYNTNLPL